MASPMGVATPGRPRCFNCGHDLTGVTRSVSCPECGKPLVEVLVRDDSAFLKSMGRRYTSRATIFGIPAISIAAGIGPDGKPGHAKGWIAIGDKATGVVALGGLARGVVAFGGLAMGVVSFGGLSVGLIGSLGGMSIAILGLALGGMAIGPLANGGFACGFVAIGGSCVGWYAWGPPGACKAQHIHQVVAGQPVDPEAAAMFDRLSWLFGSSIGSASINPMLWALATLAFLLTFLSVPAIIRWHRGESDQVDSSRSGEP